MTIGGWIIMIISVGSVTTLCVWTMYRVLTTTKKQEPDHHLGHIEPVAEDEADSR